MMMVLCPKAGPLAFIPPVDEMSEVVSCRLPQTIMGEQLVQGCYLAARAGFKPVTLWSTGIDSTNAPPSSLVFAVTTLIIIIASPTSVLLYAVCDHCGKRECHLFA